MLKFLLLVAAASSKCLAIPWNHEFTSSQLAAENAKGLFHEWRLAQSKVYETVAEEMRRFGVFSKNMERIAEGNDEFHAGKRGFLLRMNHFGDLSDDERREAISCELEEELALAKESAQYSENSPQNLKPFVGDAHFDWKDQGKVTAVKSQGGCGSCWAFSSTGAMECNFAIKHGVSPPSMSEQQLVDCDTRSHGCTGGLPPNAWTYATNAGGMCAENAYSYEEKQNYCRDSSCQKHKLWAPSGWSYVGQQSSSGMQAALSKNCISVNIQVDQFAFGYYSSGILDGVCGADTNHAVLATGFGVQNGKEYWIVKNSWGNGWGEAGYVWLCKNCGKNGNDGQCGILRFPKLTKY